MLHKSDFYQSIAHYYNLIFPVKRNKIEFINMQLAGQNQSLLDVGCATGELAVKLADHHQVKGIDSNPTMIQIAKEQSVDQKEADFQVADMLHLTKMFKEESFDCVICIGNTLAHLQNDAEVLSFLANVFRILKGNGSLIIQIVNFDKFIEQEIREFPEIDTAEINFTRKYHYLNSGKINFETELMIKSSNEVLRNSETLNPVRYNDLKNDLENTGFKILKVYGSFRGEEFGKDSNALIIQAEK